MARQKSGKEIKSISFDKSVLKALDLHCRKEGLPISTFVNSVIKKVVMSEYEFYRQLTMVASAEMSKYKLLMETAPKTEKEDNRNWNLKT